MRYNVKWGDEIKIVEAASEQDAWAAFADSHDLAKRQPKLFKREVKEAAEAPADTKPAPVKLVEAEEKPVKKAK